MAQPNLVVDQVLTTISENLDPKKVKDYALCMVYANAAARPKRVVADASSVRAFHAEWLNILGQCGWVIQEAGSGTFRNYTSGQTDSIAGQLTAANNGAALSGALETLRADIQGAADLADMWWNATSVSGYLQGAFGTVDGGPDGLQMEITTFSLDVKSLRQPEKGIFHRDGKPFEPEGPDAIFKQLLSSSLNVKTDTITAVLNEASFAPKRKQIVELLGDKFAEHYRASPQSLI